MTKRKNNKRVALITGSCAVILVFLFLLAYRNEIRYWYLLSEDFQSLGKNAQGYGEYRHRQTGIVFVLLPGGTFLMGRAESKQEEARLLSTWRKYKKPNEADWYEEALASEQPQHSVSLSPFLIAKLEVSQREWTEVMGTRRSKLQGANLPVEQVSWDDCQRFCELTGLSLPTEAQWEYACRGGTQTLFSFGDSISTDDVNYNGNYPYGRTKKRPYRMRTVAVDSFKPNGFGLYNMHGNVWEWCQDVYNSEFYKKPEATTLDPVCTSGSGGRAPGSGDWLYFVIRGGGFIFPAQECRCANRSNLPRTARYYYVGFRPCLSLPDGE